MVDYDEGTAIERLSTYEPKEGYYLAFSGGKDSIVIYRLAEKAGVSFDAHYNLTTADPPEIVYFIRDYYPNVVINKPVTTMWRLIPEKLIPPTRTIRYCCEVLKERGGSGRRVVTGIRKAESQRRSKRNLVETCYKDGTKTFINPIIDWTDKQVWSFIKDEDLNYCRLYDEGYSRLGCILCPMQTLSGKLRDKKRFPKFYEAYVRAFDRMLNARNKKGLDTSWNSGEEVMRWWIYGKGVDDKCMMTDCLYYKGKCVLKGNDEFNDKCENYTSMSGGVRDALF